MASKILLISANRCTRPDPVFPLGLTHLSAALRRAGHGTAWIDLLANVDRLDEVIDSYRPDFVGMSLRNIDDVLIGKQETFFDDTDLPGQPHSATDQLPDHRWRQRV